MSDDLTTLLREAAEGPVPPIDTADLRRRGQRRRWGVRALEAGGLVAVAALGLAVLPHLGPASPAIGGSPMASSPDAADAADGGDPDPALDDPRGEEDGPTVDAAGRRIGDLPEIDPDADVPPLGPWRPAEAPVDLAPLSMRHDDEIWYRDEETGTEGLVGAEEIAARFGSRDTFDRTCIHLTEQVESAHRELDLATEDPNRVAEAVTYLVLRQEQVRGGDGLTLALALACGVADAAPDDR